MVYSAKRTLIMAALIMCDHATGTSASPVHKDADAANIVDCQSASIGMLSKQTVHLSLGSDHTGAAYSKPGLQYFTTNQGGHSASFLLSHPATNRLKGKDIKTNGF